MIKVEYFEMGSCRGLVNAAQQMGQLEKIVDLLQQEEQTAQIAEQSAPELLKKVM